MNIINCGVHVFSSAHATVREFHNQNWKFPKKIFHGPEKGETLFTPLTDSRVFQILKNPRYAGTYAYGLRQQQFNERRKIIKYVDQRNWKAFIKNAHEGYITWDEYTIAKKQNPKFHQRNPGFIT